jgi:hypothetical protein
MRNIFKKPINFLKTKIKRKKPITTSIVSQKSINPEKIFEQKKALIAEYNSHPENKSKIGIFVGFDDLLTSFIEKKQLYPNQLTKLEEAVTELTNFSYGKANLSIRNSPEANLYFNLTNLRNQIIERKKSR